MRKDKPTLTSTLKFCPAADIPLCPTLWALPGHLPLHNLSAIVAPTGAGLTTLATQICAQITRTTRKVENDLPSVLLIPGRETVCSIRSRLAAAGANLSRILILEETHDEYGDDYRRNSTTRPPNATDRVRISQILHEYKSIRLVLIDNAEDFFATSNRPTRNKILRQLAGYQLLAETREVAVTFLTAIPSLQRDPFRTGFLSALHHCCRAVHLLAPDPESQRHRLLFTIKNTLAAPNPTLRLDFAEPHFPQDTTVPDLTYVDYLRLLHAPKKTGPAPDSRNYAIEVLRELLQPGQRLPVGQRDNPARGTIHFLIREAGLSFATVLRAKEDLGIMATRDKKRWYWHQPAPEISASAPPQEKPGAPSPQTCDSSRKSAHCETPGGPLQPPFPPIIPVRPLLATSIPLGATPDQLPGAQGVTP